MPSTIPQRRVAQRSKRPTGFSPAQQARYRRRVQRAWQAHCQRAGEDPADLPAHDTWYRRQLLACLQVFTTKQCDRVEDYDHLMLHFAQLAGDDAQVAYFSAAAERRHLKAIADILRRNDRPVAYAAAIAERMGFGQDLSNIPAANLRKLRIALHKDLIRHHHAPAWSTVPPPAPRSAAQEA
jgi:hypothetical protein